MHSNANILNVSVVLPYQLVAYSMQASADLKTDNTQIIKQHHIRVYEYY